MKSRSDVSRSARRTRRSATEDETPQRPNPSTPEAGEQLSTAWNDDSFSEERFLSPLPGGSWESQSFDSEDRRTGSRPSSRTSLRDRRKQYDTTTPTLIDEEDEDDQEDVEIASSLERSRLDELEDRGHSAKTAGFGESEDRGSSLRRTPGATQMHQSRDAADDKDAALGVGFDLVVQHAAGAAGREAPHPSVKTAVPEQTRGEIAPPDWHSITGDAATHAPLSPVPMEAAAAPPPGPSLEPGAPAVPKTEVKGPFAFAPWTKGPSAIPAEARHGAFSPNILRLTEDIGNLLQEDEDDDYTIEIPSVFRGEGEESTVTGLGSDWTGSYVFDSKFGSRVARGLVQRSNIVTRDGKQRRRTNTGVSSHQSNLVQGSILPNSTMQPKPRRSGHEVIDLGQRRDGHASPQLLSFGGAFVRPSKDSAPSSLMRPVASSPAAAPLAPYQLVAPIQNAAPLPPGEPPLGMTPPSFETYQPVPQGSGHMWFPPVQHAVANPTPTVMAPIPYQSQQQLSEMHATAQEFIPMATRSPTPQFLRPTQWQQPQPVTQPALNFDPRLEQGNWHSANSFSYNQSVSYAIQQQGPQGYGDNRSAMTPSPHVQTWKQPEQQIYPARSTEVAAARMVASSPISATHSDASQRNQARKEQSRRNTRGRKKNSKREKAVPGKKKVKDGPRSGSVVENEDAGADEVVPTSDDPVDAKRAELAESPKTRVAFKDFYRGFKEAEKISFQRAEEKAQKALVDASLPESVHWRVYLELADLAKRSNRYIEARRLYQKVCRLQPFASQGWLEYSKLEEDCGFMNRVTNILHAGLEYCEYNETLLTRAVKHQEKMGNLSSARGILARLKHVGIEKVWRTVLEGALLEARAGNHEMARRVLKYLMHHVPWYGPLYLEAYKLERDQGHPVDALQIVTRGLTTLPRYGPLWFGAFRLYEEMDVTEKQYDLPRTIQMIERAKTTISKELVWKLHLEAAQMLERTALAYVGDAGLDMHAHLVPVRKRIVLTILTCPQNLRWKIWLAAGRLELIVGNVDGAHALFRRAHMCVQQKSKSATLLDCARLAEFRGDIELARAVLCKARSFYGNDWKVWFESALLEIRNNNHKRGYEIAATGLDTHMGSGRLWATLVQLGQLVGGDKAQTSALERALNAVPKSGEVWCEGARIHLNPFSSIFDLHRARRYLHFAARFTPQFGDSFIESIRLEVLSQWLHPIAKFIWKKIKGHYIPSVPKTESLVSFISEVCLAIAVARRKESVASAVAEVKFRDIVGALRKKIRMDNLRSSIDLTDLRLACTNADPNYGSLWFHCRKLPTFTPRRVIEHAAEDIADEIFKNADVYLAAMIRRMAILTTIDAEEPHGAEETIETSDPRKVAWEVTVDKELRNTISLEKILNTADPKGEMLLLESTMHGSEYITGLSELNRYRPLADMSLLERRRVLFGTDALFP